MWALSALALLACAPQAEEKNVLVILADDLGYADLASVGKAGYTPALNDLAADGLVFSHAFANPTCSPTRDSLLTSRWGGKLDGTPCIALSGYEIPLALSTLPELANATHATALFGKYHLGPEEGVALEELALAQGFEEWCGVAANLIECDSSGYFDWQHIHGGSSSASTDYQPRVILDDLKAWWTETEGEKLAVWACALPHGPNHRPPDEELPDEYPATSTQREKYEAMIATLDRHLAEMLAVVDLDTTLVIFLGDNGTPSSVAPQGFAAKAKGTAYERGIHVPLIVHAPGVSQGLVTRMAHPADVLPTVAEYLGLTVPEGVVGVSLGAISSARPYIVAIDYFDNVAPVSSAACLRTATFKFMLVDWHTASPEERFFNLATDPNETTDLGPNAFKAIQNQMRAGLIAALPK